MNKRSDRNKSLASVACPFNRADIAQFGFSLFELLVAMAIFVVIAGASLSLFSKHLAYINQQQNLSGVNIGMRNAMSQLELDVSNAGQNLLSNVNISGIAPTFSAGVTIQNNTPTAAGACAPAANWAYPTAAACFDSLTMYSIVPCAAMGAGAGAPALVIADPGNSQVSLDSSSIIWANDPNSGASLSTDASCFHQGDELLVIQFPGNGQQYTTCDNGQFTYCIATVTLTKDAQANGNAGIQLQHNPTGGPNNVGQNNDPLGFLSGGNFQKANGLGVGFNNGAWIVDLGQPGGNTVTYSVQASPTDPTNTQLVRCTQGTCGVVLDQVIGFKVGAALWDAASGQATDDANYFFDASKYCTDAISGADCSQNPPPANDPYDFTLVRALRVSLIARTAPNPNAQVQSNFKNGFDGGPYSIQQASVIVDLRSLSDSDQSQ